jgi:hypothetical protein
MKTTDYTTTITIDQTPEEAFAAINNIGAWWQGEIKGSSGKLGDEFTYEFKPHHYSKQKVTEFQPGKKVTWLVTESKLNFLEDKSEWTGTKIMFEIGWSGKKTEIRFTHAGLSPEIECYGACSNAWGSLIKGSLRSLITTGVGEEVF